MLMPEGPGLRWIGSFNHVISLFLWTWLGVCLWATAGFTKKTVWKVCIFHCTNNGQNPSSQEQHISTVLHIVRALKRKRNGAGLLQKWDRNAIEVSFPEQGLARAPAAAASGGVELCHGLWGLLHPPEITHPGWKGLRVALLLIRVRALTAAAGWAGDNPFERGTEIPSSPPGEEWEQSLRTPQNPEQPQLVWTLRNHSWCVQWWSAGPWPQAAQLNFKPFWSNCLK